MTAPELRQLTVLSVKDPANAARVVLTLPMSRDALWAALGLIAVLNALLFSLSNLLVPGPSPLPGLFNVPLVYCAIVAGGLILTVYSLFWTGRFLGGRGTVDGVMRVVLWLQALRLLVQGVALVLLMTVPLLSALLVFAASIYGIYMLLHFIKQAHELPTMGRAAGVLIAAMLAMLLGLTLLISLFGGPIVGSFAYV
ncbi:Yip1 family protein [Sedimentitalea nanhaiensis]|uniref:Yip1 domain-containing protein n=1 Tax=Sedimentitalea nanhaiensis TaxID=999627 RepID=A0A1I7ECJ0_9RHOB|nr:Yip1 family protein [Sedimentitalea nanhaiensis]SFU21575.1 Yip1 domain-containing protein [Sedimentitalea nanhaiensis]